MWTAGVAFELCGVPIGIRADRESLLHGIGARLASTWTAVRSPVVKRLYSIIGGEPARPGIRRLFLLYQGSQRLARTPDVDDLFDTLDTDIRLYVAERATSYTCLHAGVVGWGAQAIVMAGRSMSGKTTLVNAFLDAGAAYYADDCAFIDNRGFVHPFPTPLSIRREGTARPEKVGPELLGAVSGIDPLPVGAVVLSRYRQGASWRPRAPSQGQAIMALIRHSASIRGNPQHGLDRLRRMILGARVVIGTHGDAAEVCREILTGIR